MKFSVVLLLLVFSPFAKANVERDLFIPKNLSPIEHLGNDSTYIFIIQKRKKQVEIHDGDKVFIRVDSLKYKGILQIINDSTIEVTETSIWYDEDDSLLFKPKITSIRLSEIDMIAKPKTAKTIGLIFASLPMHLTGLVMIGFGFDGAYLYPAGGAVIIGSIVGVALEGSRGKRYHAYSNGSSDGTIERKWEYSIKKN